MRVTLVVFIALLAQPRASRAFQIETPVTSGCHERITRDAARAAGFPPVAEAPTPTEDQRRAMSDLTFTLPDRDVWTMALLLGVRSNDLRDNQPIDVARLVHIHNDPDDQPAHCMRRIEHDGPQGDAQALASCRAFILGELEAGGLLDESSDLLAVEEVPLYLAFRGRVKIDLPRFAYRLGRALHALEDGYTHVFRNPQTDAVRHVGNWVDTIIPSTYRPAIDGYHHVGILDDCTRSDPREKGRVARVTAAATRVIAAIADPSPGRRARVEAAIDQSMVIEDGCALANRYCNAEELDEEDSGGCSTTRPGGLTIVLVAIGLVVGTRRRRSRSWSWSRSRWWSWSWSWSWSHGGGAVAVVVVVAVVVAVLTRSPASADAQPDPTAGESPPPSGPRNIEDPPPPSGLPNTEDPPLPRDPTLPVATTAVIVTTSAPTAPPTPTRPSRAWHLDVRAAGALENASAAITGGVGVDISRWTIGAVLEWNPWFSLDTRRGSLGAFNAYATLTRRWYDGTKFSLYSRAEVGSSTMLFELVGVDRYATGLYLAGALLGIRVPVGDKAAITFDPSHYVLPIPQLTGFPFYYRQYRITVGVEVAL